MFKGVLCAVIILACGGLGVFKAASFSERCRDLQDIKDMLQILETEITYRKDPLVHAFARISQYKDNRAMALLEQCSRKMKQHSELCSCWQESMKRVYQNSCLTAEDLLILTDMGMQLGKSSIQGQSSMFSLCNLKLDRQIEQAQEAKQTKGKMYRSMGFSIGAVIAVIFI